MMNSAVVHSNHKRRSSRSDSTSSSVVTVKKSASFSSKTGPRFNQINHSPFRTQNTNPHKSQASAYPGDSWNLPGSATETHMNTPNVNINRWSQSTSSSLSAIEAEISGTRTSSSTSQMSSDASMSMSNSRPQTSGQTQPEAYGRSQIRNPPTTKTSGLRHEPPNLTPKSMFNPTAGEYFGDNWQHRRNDSKLGEAVTAMSVQYATTQSQRRQENARQHISVDSVDAGQRAKTASTTNKKEHTNDSTTSIREGRPRSHRSPTQKTMLSKALAKANAAVLLDNAQNVEGAIEAYAEACELLQEVLVRSSDLEDRKKLSAIRSTYSNRIAELHDLDDSFASLMDKALPEDPPMDDANTSFFSQDSTAPELDTADILEQVHIPPRQESLLPQIFGGDNYLEDPSAPPKARSIQPAKLTVPMDAQYMPPPLSPRRPPSPSSAADTITPPTANQIQNLTGFKHVRDPSSESTSWLDTIDDVESSNRSSRLSSLDFGEPIGESSRNLTDEMEAEFDAALNAAVESAYDNENSHEITPKKSESESHRFSSFAEETNDRKSGTSLPSANSELELHNDTTIGYLEDSEEEEERMLEEMTQDYVFDDFHFDNKSKSALPRQSDSSSFSNRTWASSVPSTITNGTSLTTLAETLEKSNPQLSKSQLREGPLPQLPIVDSKTSPSIAQVSSNVRPSSFDRQSGLGLRERRLSGQSARQLKIETFTRNQTNLSQSKSNLQPLSMPTIEIPDTAERKPLSAPLISNPISISPLGPLPITPLTSVHSGDSMVSDSPVTPALTQAGSHGSMDETFVNPTSPTRSTRMMPPPAAVIKKNVSSTSLRARNLSLATDMNDSPITPGSAGFPPDIRKGVPPVPTPTTPFGSQSLHVSGMYLFDDQIGLPVSDKMAQKGANGSPPAALEPCPESFLLRPFWLMRCLYQTISHPRGGYVSTRLFIPRDIWRVKNVKLKVLDDKISQCDLLTAALMKLSKVDTFDADAVLEELQSFESVLDQVRSVLQKKLGSDVGLSSSSNIFKSPIGDEGLETSSSRPGNSNSAAKSFASSWRKLRSKSSTAAMNGTPGIYSVKDNSTTYPHIGLTMPTLPMTSSSSAQSTRSHANRSRAHPPPTPTQLTNLPAQHTIYMSSLARLFDSAQILDSIARQVEDPGLKFTSKTQVGLELSVRNAAEFFAFYVIRFVMTDVTLLLDKFLKRGTEWVLT